MNALEMYHAFRYEIDEYAFPLLPGEIREITFNGETIGFLEIDSDGYIGGLWVHPDYRRIGLARKAVLDYVNECGLPWRLHTVNTNKPAKKFWHSVFELQKVDQNEVDTLWEVIGCKNG